MARGSNLLLPHLHANPRPIVSLDPRQSDTLRAVRAKIDAGTYRLEAVPCLCGTPSNQAYPVAERDRYGLPVGTFLCPRCALMWSSPRLDADSAARFYRDDYRSLYLGKPQAATEFLDRQERLGEGILDTVRRLDIAIGSETRVVDIGCGAGGMLLPFRAAGATVAGCDFGERYLRAGRARGLDLRQGDAATLNEFAPVDLAVACHVLEHIPAPLEALRLWASLLSPAGALYIEVPGVWDALGKGRTSGDSSTSPTCTTTRWPPSKTSRNKPALRWSMAKSRCGPCSARARVLPPRQTPRRCAQSWNARAVGRTARLAAPSTA